MDITARQTRFLDADEFLRTDQLVFGPAWRYELTRGAIVADAAPSPEHAVILSNLAGELYNRLRGHTECRSEIGSGAVPTYEQRNTARIPDATIRCGKLPRVLFEVISPSALQHKRQWDQKRSDLQAVEGVQEIVEIFQDEVLAHTYRRQDTSWTFESIAGPDAMMELRSVCIAVPLAALYDRVHACGGVNAIVRLRQRRSSGQGLVLQRHAPRRKSGSSPKVATRYADIIGSMLNPACHAVPSIASLRFGRRQPRRPERRLVTAFPRFWNCA